MFLLCNNYPNETVQLFDKPVSEVDAESYSDISAKADAGDAESTYLLGWWTELGFGCEENPEEAAEILRLSAERGSANGMVAYADALLMSDPPEWKTAENWISRAMELGSESAKDLLPAVEWAKSAKSEQ